MNDAEINLKRILFQIFYMYDNPELNRICKAGVEGKWGAAIYPAYEAVVPDVSKMHKRK